MGKNSYIVLGKESDTFRLEPEFLRDDYMQCFDISWVSQVAPFIEEFSEEGDVIFDPFAGLGTTLLAAGMLGRKSIGIELDKSRFTLLKERMHKHRQSMLFMPVVCEGDALTISFPCDVDLLVTNFPYFHASAKNESTNIYNISDYANYLQTIEKIIQRCEGALRKDGYMIAFCENIRQPNGNIIPQAYDICKILQRYFHLKEERIVLYPKQSIAEADKTWTNRAHEYVFVAKKRDKTLDYDPYYNILNKIGSVVKYVTIGTFGIYNSPQNCVLDNLPEDVDIVIPQNKEDIYAVISLMRKSGFTLYSWQDVVDDDFSLDKLEGRYYIRAIKSQYGQKLQLDINYESDYTDFNTFYDHSFSFNGIQVASISDITSLMKIRNNSQDKELVYRIDRLQIT